MENIFGENLKKLRKKRKITLIDLAKTLKISKSALSDYENGKSKPGLEVVLKLSDYFFIPVDDLNNSIISEFENIEISGEKPYKPSINLEALEEIKAWKEKNEFQLSLLKQKNESLQTQLTLLKQLLMSKDAENSTLQVQINLLNEKLRP